jgi:hypothetical protein
VSGEENAQNYYFVLCITRTFGDFSRKSFSQGLLSRISFGLVVDRGLAALAKTLLIRMRVGSCALAFEVLDAVLGYRLWGRACNRMGPVVKLPVARWMAERETATGDLEGNAMSSPGATRGDGLWWVLELSQVPDFT